MKKLINQLIGRYFSSITVKFIFWFLSRPNGKEEQTYQTLGFTDHTYASTAGKAERFVTSLMLTDTKYKVCDLVIPAFIKTHGCNGLLQVERSKTRLEIRTIQLRYRPNPQRGYRVQLSAQTRISKYHMHAFQLATLVARTLNKASWLTKDNLQLRIHDVKFGNIGVIITGLSELTEVQGPGSWVRRRPKTNVKAFS